MTSNIFGQTIQELEYDLSWYHSSEEYGDKIEKAKKLQEIDPFNYKATEYICRYYSDREIDSVSIYFENLIAKFPENSEPYILRSEFLNFELNFGNKEVYIIRKIDYLKQGLNVNPNDTRIIYILAETYYEDFIFPLEKEKDWGFSFDFNDDLIDSTLISRKKFIKTSTFEHSADSALSYFYRLWDYKTDKNDIIYYPIRQLECYLNKSSKSPIPKDFEKNLKQCFFPSSYFANLVENWQCDFTVDYLFEIESGKRTANWLEIQLNDLQESCLFDAEVSSNTTIYRFTWLRSFHNPISIRIEKIGNKIELYWKVGKGAGGYEPIGLKKEGKKKFSTKEWIEFEKLIKVSNFESLPNEIYIPMTDGATWTLERKNQESFKAHNTNSPSKEISNACLYLLDLTNIKVNDDDRY